MNKVTKLHDDDLPEELKAQLRSGARSGAIPSPRRDQISRPFKANGEMNLNDLLIAIWCDSGEVMGRGGIASQLTKYTRSGHLTRTGVGRYKAA